MLIRYLVRRYSTSSRARAGFIVSFDDVLQHRLVEREIRHQLLQPRVLLLEQFSRFNSDGIRPPYFFRHR